MDKNVTRRDGEKFVVMGIRDAYKTDALRTSWKLEGRATEEEDEVVDMRNSELERARENGINNSGWIETGGGGEGRKEREHGGTEKQRCKN